MGNTDHDIHIILQNVSKISDLIAWSEADDRFFSPKFKSTEVRTLMSSPYYDHFKAYYRLTNALSNFIYEIYHQDHKDEKYLVKQSGFEAYFMTYQAGSGMFWNEQFWQFDEKSETIRKESYKLRVEAGAYFLKERKKDSNVGHELSYQNAEVTHPSNFVIKGYKYLVGKCRLPDDYYLRFYWNFYPDREKIKGFVEFIQKRMDQASIPFEFKFLIDPESYNLTDVAVLYVPTRYSMIVFRLVGEIHSKFAGEEFFADSTPMFTHRLEKGLSFGENPQDKRYTSFGSYRAVHLAMAIVDFYYIQGHRKLPSTEDVRAWLEKENFDYKEFHLNQHSVNQYIDEINLFRDTYACRKLPEVPGNTYLKTAQLIGNKLIKEALWYGEECNWMSYKHKLIVENKKQDNYITTGYAFESLDASLEKGRLGVAVFLYLLHQLSNNDDYYRAFDYTIRSIVRSVLATPVAVLSKTLDCKGIRYGLKKAFDAGTSEYLAQAIAKLEDFDESDYAMPVKRQEGAWRGNKLDSVMTGMPTAEDYLVADELIDAFFDKDRPFGNALGTDEFCADLSDGYAFLGYYFLRLSDPEKVPVLPLTFV